MGWGLYAGRVDFFRPLEWVSPEYSIEPVRYSVALVETFN
jgi:hypothetical protein